MGTAVPMDGATTNRIQTMPLDHSVVDGLALTARTITGARTFSQTGHAQRMEGATVTIWSLTGPSTTSHLVLLAGHATRAQSHIAAQHREPTTTVFVTRATASLLVAVFVPLAQLQRHPADAEAPALTTHHLYHRQHRLLQHPVDAEAPTPRRRTPHPRTPHRRHSRDAPDRTARS
jgi:hypothetical protein